MKLLGGILLIVGTAIGGGMLALPIATAPAGFVQSSLLLFFCWVVMTAGAFLILEVNLWLPRDTNLVSMARATLGKPGQAIAWLSCLLLMYSLLAAYIAGGSDFLRNVLSAGNINLPSWSVAILFTFILGFVVFHGIKSVDWCNRGLMFIKLSALILLLIFISPHVTAINLSGGESKYILPSVTVAMTSFGFATIVPSLRTYFNDDVKKLRKAILIGSLIPLICYILWDMAIMGVLPRQGDHGLVSILHSGRSTSEFINELSMMLNRETITTSARIFTTICLVTSFLGVALGLSDFLADGLKMKKSGKNQIVIFAATFMPSLLIVLVYPGAFIAALSYAGIYCMVLVVLLPALMAWFGRYKKNIAQGAYQVFGGKLLLLFLMLVSGGIILQNLL
jgi:tyrosine-specific transport protein